MLLQPRTQKVGILIRLQIAAGLAPITGDPIQLQKVLLNLMSNAIDAMRPFAGRPKILVMCPQEIQDDLVLTQIEHSGTGVSNYEKLFEAFFTTKESGMGIVLSVCRTIIAAHGGRIWASPAPQCGTILSLTIRLPLSRHSRQDEYWQPLVISESLKS